MVEVSVYTCSARCVLDGISACVAALEVTRRVFFFQAEDGIRDLVRSRGLGDVYKRQMLSPVLLQRLRSWWRIAHAQGKILPGGWLFPGLDLSLIHI